MLEVVRCMGGEEGVLEAVTVCLRRRSCVGNCEGVTEAVMVTAF